MSSSNSASKIPRLLQSPASSSSSLAESVAAISSRLDHLSIKVVKSGSVLAQQVADVKTNVEERIEMIDSAMVKLAKMEDNLERAMKKLEFRTKCDQYHNLLLDKVLRKIDTLSVVRNPADNWQWAPFRRLTQEIKAALEGARVNVPDYADRKHEIIIVMKLLEKMSPAESARFTGPRQVDLLLQFIEHRMAVNEARGVLPEEAAQSLCPFCAYDYHNPEKCTRVKTVKERCDAVYIKGLCWKCLVEKGRGHYCLKRCRACRGLHHLAICSAVLGGKAAFV